MLDEYECHLLAFQVQHPTHPSYNEFNEQAKKIILDLANLKYERIKEVNAVVNANLHPPEFLSPQNGLFELNETAIVASLVSCEVNKTVPPEQIGDQVENVIIRINKFINDLKEQKKSLTEYKTLRIIFQEISYSLWLL